MQQETLAILTAVGGYRPAQSVGGPDVSPNTLYKGTGFWVRPGGRLKPINGASQIAAVNIGPRIYALDQYRGEIGGSLVSSALPKESLVRYLGAALFFVSENTSQQVYINESTSTPFTLTSVTTSATAGKLRLALLNSTTYTAYDAGLDAPLLDPADVSIEANGSKSMDGICSIVMCARRLITDTTSNPSVANVQTLSAGGNNRFRVVLDAPVSGQDGWLFGGTDWARGNTGPWKVIREVKDSFSVRATNGDATITQPSSGTTTPFNLYLRPGDRVTIDSVQYYVASGTSAPTATSFELASDAAGTTPVNFPGSTADYTLSVDEVVLDWRNGELGELISFDNDLPPLLDGLMLFNNVPFGWKNNTLYPSKIGNPEAFPAALARNTQSGANIIHALAGDARIYLLTTNGLEVVTFTQNETDPFLIRQVWGFGFSSPTQAVVAEGSLYAAVGTSSGVKIVRTRIDDSPDLEFSSNVESDMIGWNIANVVMALDPANGAILAIHNNGTDTTIIPYMLQQGVWSLPQSIASQRVKDAATISNTCVFTVYNGTNFRAYQHEGGNGSGIDKYVAWPFIDKDGLRQIIKRIKVTADADSLYVYAATPGAAIPDVTSTGAASAGPFTLTGTMEMSTMIQTNVPNAQAFSIRIDSNDTDAEITEVTVTGLINRIGR